MTSLLERVGTVLAGLDLVPYTPEIRARAGGAFDPPQRALDAIHLATALSLSIDGLALVSYDRDQVRAAEAAGLPTLTPR